MKKILVKLGPQSYPILIIPGGLSGVGPMIQAKKLGRQAAVISDHTVSKLYSEKVMQSMTNSGIDSTLHVVPDGEGSKSFARLNKLYTGLIQAHLRRDGLIVALGGGVVGDLAGFAAATYLRGVRWVQVPTTLLAQVDSSVGGKVGMNHPLGKNLIGSFYQPRFVLSDPSVLATLHTREMWSGLGEVIKYGLIFSERFFSFLEKNLNLLAELSNDDLVVKTAAFCCKAKADIVKKDEKESGLRRILNFGHTLGHALEAATDFRYFRHGEAVVHGIHWASWVSWKKGELSRPVFQRIENLLQRCPLPKIPKRLNADALASHIQRDKKQSEKGLHLVLLADIGKTRIKPTDNTLELIKEWLEYVWKEK